MQGLSGSKLIAEVDPRWFEKIADDERLLLDGCFDLFHFGHANALRQAKEHFGGQLVAALHTDEEIRKNKGEVVYHWPERVNIVSSIKWVDDVIPDAPYSFSIDDLKRFKVDYTCHGDDISIGVDGKDCHSEVKAAGMYKMLRRTRGISTTTLTERLLRVVSQPSSLQNQVPSEKLEDNSDNIHNSLSEIASKLWCPSSFWDATTSHLHKVNKCPKMEAINANQQMHIVYTCGTFDLCHEGAVQFLEKSKSLGDYLVVGIYSDSLTECELGDNFPILTMEHRALCLSAVKYVDQIVINAPLQISQEIIDSLGVEAIAIQEPKVGSGAASLLEFGAGNLILGTRVEKLETTGISFDIIISRVEAKLDLLQNSFEKKRAKHLTLTLPGSHNDIIQLKA